MRNSTTPGWRSPWLAPSPTSGAPRVNYVAVTGFAKRNGRIVGLVANDAETGEEFQIETRAVINATGVYVDSVRRLDDASAATIVTPSQGAHLVLDRSFLPGQSALLVPRTDDGRVLFAIPWHDVVLVGTTDTPVGDLETEPRPLQEEVAYLVEYVGRYLERTPSPNDIKSLFAGLRPLLRGRAGLPTAKLSREHAVVVSDTGLVSITGGKWTTYRRMAIDAVDHASQVGGLRGRGSSTTELRLHGYQQPTDGDQGILAVYGSEAPQVLALCEESPDWNVSIHPSLPYRSGQVIWSARHEAARSVADVLARRTRALLARRPRQRGGRSPGCRDARRGAETGTRVGTRTGSRVSQAGRRLLAGDVTDRWFDGPTPRSNPWGRGR